MSKLQAWAIAIPVTSYTMLHERAETREEVAALALERARALGIVASDGELPPGTTISEIVPQATTFKETLQKRYEAEAAQ